MSFHSSPFFPEPFFPSGHCMCHSRRQRLLSFWITVSPLLHRAWNQGLGRGRGPWSESIALFAVLENLRGPSEGGRGGGAVLGLTVRIPSSPNPSVSLSVCTSKGWCSGSQSGDPHYVWLAPLPSRHVEKLHFLSPPSRG